MSVECNICGWTGHVFQSLYEFKNVFCPVCGSYERHRALVYYLDKTEILKKTGRVLEIGNGLVRAYQMYFERKRWKYLSLDLWPKFGDILGDVNILPFQAGTFDLIVCSHVLEHLANDFLALSEIFRVVNDTGLLIVQVPCNENRFDTVEHDTQQSEHFISEYFFYHKRDYGLDIVERLGYFASDLAEIDLQNKASEDEIQKYGFNKSFEATFFCTKSMLNSQYPDRHKRNVMPMKRHWLIERRAYEIFLARNKNGSALEDWVKAESEINNLSDEEIGRLNVFSILKKGETEG